MFVSVSYACFWWLEGCFVYVNKCVCAHTGRKHPVWSRTAKWQTSTQIYFSSVEVGWGSSGARHSGGGVGTAASRRLSLGTAPQCRCHVPPGRFSPHTNSIPLFTCSPLSKNSRGVIESLCWLLHCNNCLCKIEPWLWAGANHSNLASHGCVTKGSVVWNLNALWVSRGVSAAQTDTKGQIAKHMMKTLHSRSRVLDTKQDKVLSTFIFQFLFFLCQIGWSTIFFLLLIYTALYYICCNNSIFIFFIDAIFIQFRILAAVSDSQNMKTESFWCIGLKEKISPGWTDCQHRQHGNSGMNRLWNGGGHTQQQDETVALSAEREHLDERFISSWRRVRILVVLWLHFNMNEGVWFFIGCNGCNYGKFHFFSQ